MPQDFSREIEAAFVNYENTRKGKVELPPPRFLFGPYFPPDVQIGDEIKCARQELVRVTRWSDGPIPWPQCRKHGCHALIIFADLERALRNESSLVVALAWGISRITIWKCRQAMGLENATPGTTARRSDITDAVLHFSRDENGQVISASRGARKACDTSQRSRGVSQLTWAPEVVAMMGVLSDREIARTIGRAAQSVGRERKRRGILPLDWGGARQNDLCVVDGDRVADRRRELDLTQAQTGARIGRKKSYISQLEVGYYPRIARSMLEDLARALECQPDDLCPLEAATAPDRT